MKAIHYGIYITLATRMQKKFTHRSPGIHRLMLAGNILKQFFLVVFAFTFFLQQFHPLSFSGNMAGSQKFSSRLLHTKQAQENTSVLSQEAAHSATEMESDEDEDDDRQDNEKEYCSLSGLQYPTDQLGHNYIQKIRYLQLTSSVQQQPLIPFFILHHSWKNHLG